MNKFYLVLIFSSFICFGFQQYCPCPENQFWVKDKLQCQSYPTSPEDSNFVPNCKEYYWNLKQRIICVECQTSYMLDLKNNECILTNLSNCARVQKHHYYADYNDSEMEQSKYFLASKESAQEQNLYCDLCEKGYYLTYNRKQCIQNPQLGEKIYVQNCQEYKQEKDRLKCYSCNSKYYLQENECKPYPQTPENCEFFIYQNHKIKCTVCQYGFTFDEKNNQCVKIQDVSPNCEFGEFKKNGLYFSCSICNPGFYVEQNYGGEQGCKGNPIEREKGYVKNCQYYHHYFYQDDVQCVACQGLYYLNSDQNSCEPVARPIKYCELYDSPFTCESCGSNGIELQYQTQCFICPYSPIETKNEIWEDPIL